MNSKIVTPAKEIICMVATETARAAVQCLHNRDALATSIWNTCSGKNGSWWVLSTSEYQVTLSAYMGH